MLPFHLTEADNYWACSWMSDGVLMFGLSLTVYLRISLKCCHCNNETQETLVKEVPRVIATSVCAALAHAKLHSVNV